MTALYIDQDIAPLRLSLKGISIRISPTGPARYRMELTYTLGTDRVQNAFSDLAGIIEAPTTLQYGDIDFVRTYNAEADQFGLTAYGRNRTDRLVFSTKLDQCSSGQFGESVERMLFGHALGYIQNQRLSENKPN